MYIWFGMEKSYSGCSFRNSGSHSRKLFYLFSQIRLLRLIHTATAKTQFCVSSVHFQLSLQTDTAVPSGGVHTTQQDFKT